MNSAPTHPTALWPKLKTELNCWEFTVTKGKKNHTVLLTHDGWVLGAHEDLTELASGFHQGDIGGSELGRAWFDLNRDALPEKKVPRPLRFGRRTADVIMPHQAKPAPAPDRTEEIKRSFSISSHSRRASRDSFISALHSNPIVTVQQMPRRLEVDKKKAASYQGRTLESHHIVEDNLLAKLESEKINPGFARPKAICVLLTAEFHQRYMSVKRWERAAFTAEMDREKAKDELFRICKELYADRSLASIHLASQRIIQALFDKLPVLPSKAD